MIGTSSFKSLAVLAALSGVAAPLWGSTPGCGFRDTPNAIYPGNPTWAVDYNVYPVEINASTVAINGANPRSGNGSLAVTTSGSLFDWGFFQRLAPGGGAWGLLSAINCLTFDWYRQGYLLPEDAPDALFAETWQEQTPVLRLLVRDVVDGQTLVSHLVWERWYNTKGVLTPTENDLWHFEDLTTQQLWRHFDGGNTYTNLGCANGDFSTSSQLQTYDIGGWVTNCYSSAAEVYGIMIGVGSYWPGEYAGNIDNVQLRFAGEEGFAVEDNFELPAATTTPEPATVVLLASGLAAMGLAARLKRRKPTASS